MIINPKLNSMLEATLNKRKDMITDADLKKISTLWFTKATETGNQEYPIEELLKFPQLQNLILESTLVKENDMKILGCLPNLKSIEFKRCILENGISFSDLSSLENVIIDRSFIEESACLSTIQGIKTLKIIFPYNEDQDINISDLNCSDTLETLWLEGCCLTNVSSLTDFKNVSFLNLMYTEMPHFDFIQGMSALKEMYVEKRYKENESLRGTNIAIHTSETDLVMGGGKGIN